MHVFAGRAVGAVLTCFLRWVLAFAVLGFVLCALCLVQFFGWRRWPGIRPGERPTFLLRNKKVGKEVRPAIPVLSLRYRQPVVLALSGVSRELARCAPSNRREP